MKKRPFSSFLFNRQRLWLFGGGTGRGWHGCWDWVAVWHSLVRGYRLVVVFDCRRRLPLQQFDELLQGVLRIRSGRDDEAS